MSTVMNTFRETLSVLLQRARAGDTAALNHCQKCHGPWSNNLKLIARRRGPVHFLIFLESSRIMIAKKAVPQGELLFQEHGNAQKMSQ